MSQEIREADLRALLGVAAVEAGEAVPAGGVPESVLQRAFALIRCDNVSFCDFDPRRQEGYCGQEFPVLPSMDGLDGGAFMRHYWSSTACAYPSVSGDETTVTRISDFCTLPELRSSGMYVEYLSHYRFEREIMLCLPTPGDRTRRLIFFRGPGSDFSERDRLLLSLLRPMLSEAYRGLHRARRPAQNLTQRQLELLQLVASGHTNNEIASRMFVSPFTVRKHLENIYERLGVANRAAAVAIAFSQGPE